MTDRPARRLAGPLAWSLSIVGHLGVLVFAFLITWSVVRTPADRPIVVVAAPGARPEYRPVRTTQPTRATASSLESITRSPEIERASSSDVRSLLSDDRIAADEARPAAEPASTPLPAVAFGGVQTMAERITLVVDASGSMIGAFPAVVEEIERTADARSAADLRGAPLPRAASPANPAWTAG